MAITGFLSLDEIFQPTGRFRKKIYPILDPNALIYIPYPRVNCLKTIPFTAAHTYIAHIWQYPPPPPGVEYQNFKMDSVWTAIRLITPNRYMASIDLKDAYYSVPIAKPHQKYLKFEWNNMLYKFTCFPNSLAGASL